MRVKRPVSDSIFAVIFICAAFFAICILPGTASAEVTRSAFGPRFYSSGYSANTPVWPGMGKALRAHGAGGARFAAASNLLSAGSVQFDSASYSIGEAGVTATILVTRTLGTDGAIFVNFATANGTATAGQDYGSTTGSLFWADGDDSLQGFTIPITDDNFSEGNETVNVTLSNPVGGVVIGSPNPAVLTIIDNDQGAPTLSINDVSQPEGNGPNQMVFTVTLSSASAQTVTGNYATANGTATAPSDFTAVPPTAFTLNPGETAKPIAIDINGDTTPEPAETFFVNLSDATNAVISDSQGMGTLTNDDGAAVDSVQLSSLTFAVSEDAGTATITVVRSGSNVGAATVDFATSNGTATAGQDYTATSGTLSWVSGDGSPKTFTIPITEDVVQESNETVNIALSNPIGGVAVGSPGSAVLTILDNDSQPSISIHPVTQQEGNGPNQMIFDVTLSSSFAQPVTVNYATANGTATAGSDYVAIGSTVLTFNPGDTLKQIAVNINGDFDIEPDETLLVNLSGAANATIFDAQATGTLVNDDFAGVIRFESANFSVSEGTPTAVITVIRTGGMSSGVSVQYFANDGTARSGEDFNRVSGVLVFAPDQATKTFNIPIINDQVHELDETVNLALDSPTGGATFGSPINAILTINDNDDLPTLSINDVSLAEGDTGLTPFVFAVTLTGQSSQPVTVLYSTADGSAASPGDYTPIQNADITFNPGETTKQITVQARGDYNRELNETFFVNLTSALGATLTDPQGAGTIVNDDVGGAFRFNASEYTAGEPGGPITITVQRTGGLANNVTVNYATTNGTATAGQDYTAVSGTLTFDGGQTSRTFTIPINNDGVPEPDETLNLILSDPTGGGILGNPNTAVVTITDISQPGTNRALFDYDADGRADLSVRRPSDNRWYILRGTAGFMIMEFGVAGDLLTPADYDGDGRTDIAVFRPSTGTWYIFNSGNQTFQTFNWGADGDLPAPADHDGDGKADLVVFRQSNGTWYRRFSNNTFSQVVFGLAGDKPVVGDFDGDGKADIGVFRQSDNNWYIQKSTLGFFVQTWGQAGDIPAPADYDGDARTDIAVFRPSTGQWFRVQSTAGFGVLNWGVNGDRPVPADYDGDGKADVAVFRPSTGNWHIIGSVAGISQTAFGQNGDVPTEGAFIY